MTQRNDADVRAGPIGFAKDFVGVDYHSDGHTHIDALCHVAYEGCLYNGVAADSVTAEGAAEPRRSRWSRTVSSVAACCSIFRGCEACRGSSPASTCSAATSRPRRARRAWRSSEGDILLVRTGHARRLAELGPWDTGRARPACIRRPCPCWPSEGSPRSAATATATPRRARPRASPFRSTCWR